MAKASTGARKCRGVARKALACVASVALAAGLMPGIALADGGDATTPQEITGGEHQYGSIKVDFVDELGFIGGCALNVSPVNDNDKTTVDVTGDVEATGPSTIDAIRVHGATADSSARVGVGGDVSAEAQQSHATGARIACSNGFGASVSVAGVVEAKGGCANGLYISCDSGSSAVVSVGSVKATSADAGKANEAVGVNAGSSNSSVECIVEGDVVAENTAEGGVSVGVATAYLARVAILVGGTVKASTVGVVLRDSANMDNKDVTAWKIDAPIVAGRWNGSEYVADDDLAATINYIIKAENIVGAVFSLSNTNLVQKKYGNSDKDTYDTAKRGTTVSVSVTPLEGYDLLAVYADKEKTIQLQKDPVTGLYSYEVPDGGGVCFTADVAKNQFDVVFKNDDGTELQSGKVNRDEMPVYTGETPTKAATVESVFTFADWAPALKKATEDAVYLATFTESAREYEMSFDLDGGTVDGKTTYTQAVRYGDTITLPTPVRDGHEFQYWEGSRYYGGDSYKVVGPHSFKAIWKEKEPAPTPEPTPAEEKPVEEKAAEPAAETKPAAQAPAPAEARTESTSGAPVPATGDEAPVLPAAAMLLLSAAALAAVRARSRGNRAGRRMR